MLGQRLRYNATVILNSPATTVMAMIAELSVKRRSSFREATPTRTSAGYQRGQCPIQSLPGCEGRWTVTGS
ncbi:hypothetical protein I41_37330 [Lacipirellula limnantheis]|uniref:Uncharacterized protein n=1 Tax=Lacipirellula limnantheis TaxID=2528024 RepID=A0A517U1N4_9BACT|nr:hypothetical protein I41_37330 [Lacipirellula limnantheis]